MYGSSTHQDMIRVDSWLPILDDNHGPTNSPTITSYMNSSMMMVKVDTDELVHLPSSPKLAELCNESEGEPAHPNDRTVDVDNISMVAINLSTSR